MESGHPLDACTIFGPDNQRGMTAETTPFTHYCLTQGPRVAFSHLLTVEETLQTRPEHRSRRGRTLDTGNSPADEHTSVNQASRG